MMNANLRCLIFLLLCICSCIHIVYPMSESGAAGAGVASSIVTAEDVFSDDESDGMQAKRYTPRVKLRQVIIELPVQVGDPIYLGLDRRVLEAFGSNITGQLIVLPKESCSKPQEIEVMLNFIKQLAGKPINEPYSQDGITFDCYVQANQFCEYYARTLTEENTSVFECLIRNYLKFTTIGGLELEKIIEKAKADKRALILAEKRKQKAKEKTRDIPLSQLSIGQRVSLAFGRGPKGTEFKKKSASTVNIITSTGKLLTVELSLLDVLGGDVQRLEKDKTIELDVSEQVIERILKTARKIQSEPKKINHEELISLLAEIIVKLEFKRDPNPTNSFFACAQTLGLRRIIDNRQQIIEYLVIARAWQAVYHIKWAIKMRKEGSPNYIAITREFKIAQRILNKNLIELEPSREQQEIEERREDAALLIQSIFKMHKAKKQLKELKVAEIQRKAREEQLRIKKEKEKRVSKLHGATQQLLDAVADFRAAGEQPPQELLGMLEQILPSERKEAEHALGEQFNTVNLLEDSLPSGGGEAGGVNILLTADTLASVAMAQKELTQMKVAASEVAAPIRIPQTTDLGGFEGEL